MLYKYSGIHSKTKAMGKDLLTEKDYEALLNVHSVKEVAVYLKDNTGYHDDLISAFENTIRRSELEVLISNSFFGDLTGIAKFSSAEEKRFFKVYILRYEIDILKSILRGFFSGDKLLNYTIPEYYKRFFTIDIAVLNDSANFDALIDNLKGTKYYMPLSRFQTNKEHLNMFSLEMTLDDFYFKTVWKLCEKLLHGKDLKLVNDTLGSEIDLLNIMWIIRCKKYYNTPNAIIFAYLIPIQYKLKKEEFISLVESKTAQDVINTLEQTHYKNVFTNEVYIEVEYKKYMLRKFLWRYRKEPFSIACPLAYLHLKENEIDNLIKIIEGIRYNADIALIKKYLIRVGDSYVG